MLTKTIWNSLTSESKRRICVAIYGETVDNHPHLPSLINTPYRHNFDFNDFGHTLKELLSNCRQDKDGNIIVTSVITPSYNEAN